MKKTLLAKKSSAAMKMPINQIGERKQNLKKISRGGQINKKMPRYIAWHFLILKNSAGRVFNI